MHSMPCIVMNCVLYTSMVADCSSKVKCLRVQNNKCKQYGLYFDAH